MTRRVLLGVMLGLHIAHSGVFAQEMREANRVVLVELFTSQGCDMCPTAEQNLGQLEGNQRVIPIALHVDYFNDPWHDPFSDKLYSQRQAAYNAMYTKPKNAEYGVYYTPMIMIDGVQSENGRDPAGIQRSIREALNKPPQVTLKVTLELKADKRSGVVNIGVSDPKGKAVGRDVIVCAVLRDDRIVTNVPAGENAGKSLTSRFPARANQFEVTRISAEKPLSKQFAFKLPAGSFDNRVGVVVFVQDQKSGEIYQSAYLPWSTEVTPATTVPAVRSKAKR